MHNEKRIALLTIVTITIIILLLIISQRNVKDEDTYIEDVQENITEKPIDLKWHYTVDIYFNGPGNYTLYLPTPFTSDSQNNLTDNITRMYYWLIDVNDTQYGQAFIINWNTSAGIQSGLRRAEYAMLSFEEQIYSSFNKTNSRLSVHIELMCTNGEGYEIFATDLNGEGWEPVEIEYHSAPID